MLLQHPSFGSLKGQALLLVGIFCFSWREAKDADGKFSSCVYCVGRLEPCVIGEMFCRLHVFMFSNVLAHYFDVRHADQALGKDASISHDH
jgi:hypothetical protein